MFKNKVVLVTGGSSGIGAATALCFVEAGARVVITYKENREGAEKVRRQAQGLGGELVIFQSDLSDEMQAKASVHEAIKHFGRLDILVNNAGGYISGDEWDGESEVWLRSLKQNLLSVMSVSKYAIQIFQKQRSGVIVSVSSRYSVAGKDDVLSYAASKAAIVNLTQTYANLLIPFGRANAVSPSAVRAGYWATAPQEEIKDTLARTPLGKLVEPEEVARLIVYLSSDDAKNITGQNILIDGGYNLK